MGKWKNPSMKLTLRRFVNKTNALDRFHLTVTVASFCTSTFHWPHWLPASRERDENAKFMRFLENNGLCQIERYFNHQQWATPSREMLGQRVFVNILEGDYKELRASVESSLARGRPIDTRAHSSVNYFSWGWRGSRISLRISPLIYACILGRYSCVRVLLEEYEHLFHHHDLFLPFADASISVAAAMFLLDLFPECVHFTQCNVKFSLSFNGEVSSYIKNIAKECKTDYHGKKLILRLLKVYFPNFNFEKSACILQGGETLSLPILLQKVGWQGENLYPRLLVRDVPSLLHLSLIGICRKISRKNLETRLKGEIPRHLHKMIFNKCENIFSV